MSTLVTVMYILYCIETLRFFTLKVATLLILNYLKFYIGITVPIRESSTNQEFSSA
jgi:hypothetical protein